MLSIPGKKLGLSDKAVLGVMQALSVKSGRFYMAVPTLAEDLGTTPSTIRRIIRRLEKGGWVVCAERGGHDGRSSSVYEVQESRIQEAVEQAAKARAEKPANAETERESEGKKGAAEGAQSACPGAGTLPGQGAQSAPQVVEMSQDDEALLSLAFSVRSSKNQRSTFFDAVNKAREAGVPDAWLANALAWRHRDPFPPRVVNEAERRARKIVKAAMKATGQGGPPRKRFQDLLEVVNYVRTGGEWLLPSMELAGVQTHGGNPITVGLVVRHATTWPEAAKAADSRAPVEAECVQVDAREGVRT